MLFLYFIPRGILLRVPVQSVSHHLLKSCVHAGPPLGVPNRGHRRHELPRAARGVKNRKKTRRMVVAGQQGMLVGSRAVALPIMSFSKEKMKIKKAHLLSIIAHYWKFIYSGGAVALAVVVRDSTCSNSQAPTSHTTGCLAVDSVIYLGSLGMLCGEGRDNTITATTFRHRVILILRASSKVIISRTCHPHSARTVSQSVSHHRAISVQTSGKHMSLPLVPFFAFPLTLIPYSSTPPGRPRKSSPRP